MEYCPKGALADVLLNDDIPLTWSFRFSFAADVANGMDYLHSHGLVHARLNSSNCVVDDRWSVKITGTWLGDGVRAIWLELIRTRKSFNRESKDLVSLMRFNWWMNRKRTVKCTLSSVWIINQEIISVSHLWNFPRKSACPSACSWVLDFNWKWSITDDYI